MTPAQEAVVRRLRGQGESFNVIARITRLTPVLVKRFCAAHAIAKGRRYGGWRQCHCGAMFISRNGSTERQTCSVGCYWVARHRLNANRQGHAPGD